MLTVTQAHKAVLDLLAPVTRNRYTYAGDSRTTVQVNPNGLDVHDGRVGSLAAHNGIIDTFLVIYPHLPAQIHSRLAGGASGALWGFRAVLGAGSREAAVHGIDRVLPLLARARLADSTSFLTPYLDQVVLLPDEDTTPPRWSVPLIYTATLH